MSLFPVGWQQMDGVSGPSSVFLTWERRIAHSRFRDMIL
jgi:hypothetical protein